MCLLIGAVALASGWPRWGGPIDLRWDGGAYYILGTSLARGEGYRILSEPGGLSSSLHPPLVPAFVAAHELLLRTTDPVVVGRALRVTVALCSAAYAIVVFLLLSASLPRALAAAVTLVGVLQPQYVYFTDASTRKPFLASSRSSSSSCAGTDGTRSASSFAACARSLPTRRGPRASPCSPPGWSTTRSGKRRDGR
jgi:hypothetical protein